MIGTVRALIRLTACVLADILALLCWALTLPLHLLSRRAAIRCQRVLIRLWAKTICAICRVRIDVIGAPPAPPFFLVSNHLSYLDIVVLLSLVDGHFLAKAEISNWPFVKHLARAGGTLFIDRSRKADLTRVIDVVEDAIERGGGLIVFPEGTSSRGETVLPFKSSLFEVAIRTGLPVSYLSLAYRTPPGSPPADLAVCWWGDAAFFSHMFGFLKLRRVDARVVFGNKTLTADSRKALAETAHRAVLELIASVREPAKGGRRRLG